ncbi:hypothetical protein LTR53_011036 [Teratosphaeriaceae sp. CCFEE 6253]|nr:hypothetical protein LTR53_011036 [Teratosphaeriaceae sp. CCFEE 6253]
MDEAINGGNEVFPIDGQARSTQSSPTSASAAVKGEERPSITQAGNNSAQASVSDDTSDDYEDERETRFHGPASTWRKHTAEERDLVASLDQERANDLSAHLYNTHALKSRLRDPQRVAAARSWQSKRTWLSRDDDGKVPWHPDWQWTAWPLPASEVPRKQEVFAASPAEDDEDGTYRKVELWRPSADLEDELHALMMRRAKEQFREHCFVGADEHDVVPEPPAKRARTEDDGGSDSSERETKGGWPPRQTGKLPEFLADEDEAAVITRPAVRHILTKLDDLLNGLHSQSRSRNAASRSKSRARDSVGPAESKELQQRAEVGAANDPGIEGDDDTEGAEVETDEDEMPIAPKARKRRSPQAPIHQLGQRDWSEVLGIASLVGWDPVVVDRAARRCASLFGEGMAFRTMPETTADRNQDTIVEYRPDMIPAQESEAGIESEDSSPEPASVRSFCCPYEDCPRYHEPYLQAWRWREHLRRRHKLSAKEVWHIEGREESEGDASPSDSKPVVIPPEDDEPMVDASASSAIESEESDMAGGVHVDGFLQPITAMMVGRGKDVRARRRRRPRNTDTASASLGKRRNVVGGEGEPESGM